MYGGLGVSAPSLHRESTDSLIIYRAEVYIQNRMYRTLFLLVFHNLACNWTVQLCCSYTGVYLCDNIGLVLACLLRGSTNASASPNQYMTQPSGIPILSPVLFMHVGDPYIPPF